MQLSCMESSSGLTAQPLFLWITQANFDNFSKKASALITANIIVTNFALTAFRTDILFFPLRPFCHNISSMDYFHL